MRLNWPEIISGKGTRCPALDMRLQSARRYTWNNVSPAAFFVVFCCMIAHPWSRLLWLHCLHNRASPHTFQARTCPLGSRIARAGARVWRGALRRARRAQSETGQPVCLSARHTAPAFAEAVQDPSGDKDLRIERQPKTPGRGLPVGARIGEAIAIMASAWIKWPVVVITNADQRRAATHPDLGDLLLTDNEGEPWARPERGENSFACGTGNETPGQGRLDGWK